MERKAPSPKHKTMSNASSVLDEIIKKSAEINNLKSGNAFEKFVFLQLLKDYPLTDHWIDEGIIDGEGDGGIDGFFVLVNGIPYTANPNFQWPREDVRITVWIITCKHWTGFQEAPLVSMHATLSELWNLGKTNKDFHGRYSKKLLHARKTFLDAYMTLACFDPLLEIHLVYASRGDASCVPSEPKGRMQQLVEQAKTLFAHSKIRGIFIGARELVQCHRKVRNEALALPVVSLLKHDENNFIVIAKLRDYYGFVKGEEGQLRRNLFASNVRAFLGYNSVNEAIDNTLRNPNGVNFWWLNNGITILADKARVISGQQLRLWGVQIVNGLQTTETLYRHFASGRTESLESEILIRVLTSQEDCVRDRIIQATNNQSSVESYSLRATDEIQRDIEEVLNGADFYYNRLDHDPKNKEKPSGRVIEPIELAKSFLSIVYRNPAAAAKLQIKFTRNPLLYNAIFSRNFPVDRWPLLAAVWRAAERVYVKKIGRRQLPLRHCKRWLPLVVYCVVAKLAGRFDFGINDLFRIDWCDEKNAVIVDIWNIIVPHFDDYQAVSRGKLANPKAAYDDMLLKIAQHTGLDGVECANKRNLPTTVKNAEVAAQHDYLLTESFLERVRNALPSQPWPIGVHRTVAEKLSLRDSLVHAAIDELTARGLVNRQKDGIVYNQNGMAIAIDAQRCARTLEEVNADGPLIWD